MNERIKKLAEQAGFDLYEDGSFRVEPGQWINAELERFSDLIVRECIKMVENEAEQYAEPTWAVELVNDMHERFGVAE